MKLKELLGEMDRNAIQRMAKLSRTTPRMLRYQIANGHKRPSLTLATRIVLASRKIYQDDPQRWLSLTEWFPQLPKLLASEVRLIREDRAP